MLQELALSKPFNQNFQGHTFKEFEEIAKRVDPDPDQKKSDKTLYKVEKEFW